jgi:hypothetical protein
MTKAENREAAKARYYASMGHADMAARTLSALYRAASRKSQVELLKVAQELKLTALPDFII